MCLYGVPQSAPAASCMASHCRQSVPSCLLRLALLGCPWQTGSWLSAFVSERLAFQTGKGFAEARVELLSWCGAALWTWLPHVLACAGSAL